jgi:hypothetical protein
LFFGYGLVFLPKANLSPQSSYLASYVAISDMQHHAQLILLRRDLSSFLPELASNHDPPDFHFPSSWDYGCVPPCTASTQVFLMLLFQRIEDNKIHHKVYGIDFIFG